MKTITQLTDKIDQRNQELRPGAVLTREWNGHNHRVMVVDGGFAFEGKTYDSLSKVAFAVTPNGTDPGSLACVQHRKLRPRHDCVEQIGQVRDL